MTWARKPMNGRMVFMPIFDKGELVGWGSQFGHTVDMGGPVPGSLPTDATTIYGEGTRIPPVKLFDAGKLNEDLLDTILNNSRVPTMNYFDLMAIVATCRTAEKRVIEMCDRFGKDVLLDAYEVLLDRTQKAMRQLIQMILPEKPASFEGFIDDDGRGNGPYKMKLTMWREGDHAYFDWTGTDPQAPGPINFFLNEEMFKMFIGVYLIMVFDPLDRAAETVRLDVIRGLVSLEKAERANGVVINPETKQVDEAASRARREQMRASRAPIETFTLGPVPEPIGVMRKAAEQKPAAELKMQQTAD